MHTRFISKTFLIASTSFVLSNAHAMETPEPHAMQVSGKFQGTIKDKLSFQDPLESQRSKVIYNKCITKISEVLEDLDNIQGNTIAVWDWDDTVAPWDENIRTRPRKFEPRESGENGTLAVMKKLQDRAIKNMVLTGRLTGFPLELRKERFEITVKNMLELLGQEWIQQGPFKNTDTLELLIPNVKNQSFSKGSKERPLYFLAHNHLVFAGGNQVKGIALQMLIDREAFISTPDNIIFIDNEDNNTKDLEKTFKDSPQNLYIYYYPRPKENLNIERLTQWSLDGPHH